MLKASDSRTVPIDVTPTDALDGRHRACHVDGRFYFSPDVFRAINTASEDELNDLLDNIPVLNLDGVEAMSEIKAELCLD